MLKIVLLFLFCAISGYGINGHPSDANVPVQLENKVVPEIPAPVNPSSISVTVSSTSLPVTTSNKIVTEPGTNTVASNTVSTKESSASTKDQAVGNAPTSVQINKSVPMAAENPSKTVIDDIKVPITVTIIPPVTTQKTTVAPITTTTEAPIEPLPAPKAGKWMVNGTNQTCIIINMAVQFNITYIDTGNKTTFKLFNLPDNDNKTIVTGQCGELEQYITLNWNGTKNVTNYFTIHFSKNETTKQYSLHHLEVAMRLNPNNTVALIHDTPLVSTELSSSYKCLRQQNFTLAQNGTVNSTGYFLMSDLQFQAFKTDNSENFGQVKDCKLDTPDIVPIAVGCALAGLVVIVLVAYLMGRKRSQARGYFSM